MNVFLFGNGNLGLSDFLRLYRPPLEKVGFGADVYFTVCDFRGVDTLTMEFLKSETPNVSVYHIGELPRYLPDRYQTEVGRWRLVGGFAGDGERDAAAIAVSTHFLAFDFNSDAKRKSGTQKNIEKCLSAGKVRL
ncbi:MAG: hypothetical protein JSS81_13695 [Acidobacteria bacterium]|nr:hypothetical protein [Acidobacteriota bacterium]